MRGKYDPCDKVQLFMHFLFLKISFMDTKYNKPLVNSKKKKIPHTAFKFQYRFVLSLVDE